MEGLINYKDKSEYSKFIKMEKGFSQRPHTTK